MGSAIASDPDRPRGNANTGEPEVELDGDDLDARERSGCLGRYGAGEGKSQDREGQAPHRSNGTRANEPAFGTIGVASVWNHCSSTEQ